MDEHTVRHVAKLARLELAEGEIARLAGDLSKITHYIEQMGKLDVRHVEATIHPVVDENAWRPDEIHASFPRDVAVKNAPDKDQGFFKVPPVIE
ncbi:MAG: Asp-tRNA(Asn)/Glu-tRNA(Gln) amidotransferase subunit GatC [Planctomycetes bacterium]|nr:Asp-tRNA(Asn)/Glu-tRNA(Gln) amidotransferase subunit GatC [Planctomycetota bacterium]